MRFLVTGAAGFIGFHLSLRLLSDGHTVVGIDNLNSYYDIKLKKARLNILKKNSNKKNFIFFKQDLKNSKKLKKIFRRYNFNFVIHLAAQAGIRFSIKQPRQYIDSNIIGFYNILECVKDIKSKLIFASSSSVYGKTNKRIFNENHKTSKPLQLYAATKKSNEVMGHAYYNLYNLTIIGLRFFTVYGPFGRPDMSIYKFTENIVKGKKIDLYNYGNHLRDFTNIIDVIDCVINCVKKYKDNKKPKFEIFNVGNSKPIKINYLVQLISKALQKKSKKKYIKIQMGDMKNTKASISKSRDLLNFKPKITIEMGVRRFVNWYKHYNKILN